MIGIKKHGILEGCHVGIRQIVLQNMTIWKNGCLAVVAAPLRGAQVRVVCLPQGKPWGS